MERKKKVVIGAVALIAVLIVWKILSGGGFRYAGTVEATEVDLSSRLATTVGAYAVDEGDPVKAGQGLVTLTGDDIRIAAEAAEADYHRAVQLYKNGSMAREIYDHLKTQWEAAKLKVDWCSVKSPIDGLVLDRYHEPGEWVNPGTKLLTVADLSKVWAVFYVPQTSLAKIALNQVVTGTLPEMKGSKFEGHVTHIAAEAEFTPKNVQTRSERTRLVYGVKVTFLNTDSVLKPGMTLEAKLPN